MGIWRGVNPILYMRSWKPPLTEEEKAARKEKSKRKKVKSEDGDDESHRLLPDLCTWKSICRNLFASTRSRKQKKSKKAQKEGGNET